MMTDTKIFDYISKRTKYMERIDKIKSQPHQETEQHRKNEGNNLIVCCGRNKDSNGRKNGSQKNGKEGNNQSVLDTFEEEAVILLKRRPDVGEKLHARPPKR